MHPSYQEGPRAGTVAGATVPDGFVYFAHCVTLFVHGVTLFAQRVTLEQIFLDSTHVVKNEG